MVRQDQFDGIIAGLRYGRAPVLAADLFESLRTALIATKYATPVSDRDFLEILPLGGGTSTNDSNSRQHSRYFLSRLKILPLLWSCRMTLNWNAYFDTFKNDLPSAMSPNPGFKEPHRIQYASLMADQKKFEAAAEKTITDKDIEEFYEKNKETRFREAPSAPPVTKEPATDFR